MFLKKLEIMGFKSFAEPLQIDFVPGVTAIVGPNGSGKSNVADAIRWVLGEQSAKSLRGAKMEDVIFSGSDAKKAVNLAEVTLVLDNEAGHFPLDYNEISIKRRLFRTGESEYFLNGQACRLKDLQTIFMDSGLGRDAFSIISQGRVDEVLNSRPFERRSIFDEAAGVLKYRTRKQQAEKKLVDTESNLDRVYDILLELDRQLEPLELQAKEAQQEAELAKEAQALERKILFFDVQQAEEKMQEEALYVAQLVQQKEQQEQEEKKQEQAIQFMRKQLEEQEQLIQQRYVEQTTVTGEAEKWQGRLHLVQEKERNTETQIERFEKEREQFIQQVNEQRKEVKRHQQTSAELTEKETEIKEQLKKITNLVGRSLEETEQEIERLKGAYIDQLNEQATLRNDKKHAADQRSRDQFRHTRIQQTSARLDQQFQQIEQKEKQCQQQVQLVEKQVEEATKVRIKSREEITNQEMQLKEKEHVLQKAYQYRQELIGRKQTLRSLEAEFAGFQTGVKTILQARDTGKLVRIVGAVAELIEVEKKYGKAIEVALGGAMQQIITEDSRAARTAIQYLKQQRSGRATFLPMDVMKPRTFPQSALTIAQQHEEFIGTAADLIQASEAVQPIIANLLGSVVVAKTLDGASQLAKLLNYRYRIVTLDGDIVHAGGSLSGGSSSQRASVFSRKLELEQVNTELGRFTQQVQDAEQQVATHRDQITSLYVAVQKNDQQQSLYMSQLEPLQKQLLEIVQQRQQIESERRLLQVTTSEQQHEKMNYEELTTTIEKELLRVAKELEQKQEQLTQLEKLAQNWRLEEQELKEQQAKLRERLSIIRTEQQYVTERLQLAEQSEQQLSERLQHLAEEIQQVTDPQVAVLSQEEIEQQLQLTLANKQRIAYQLAELTETTRQLAQQLMLAEKNNQLSRTQLAVSGENWHKHSLKHAKAVTHYQNLLEQLQMKFGLDLSIRMEWNQGEIEGTRQRLQAIQEQRAVLGVVNPHAIVEYAEVKERHHFLTAERNDLLEAKATLTDAMSEMDEEMTTRFHSTFEAIRMQFQQVFQKMFQGGEADLQLTDPSNLLETGVEITARPPGKKQKNLRLLSGGERSLTAISLLFAITEVRPVPFCILDEVEAALDEANVLRFSQYLQKTSEDVQFIVITHRKGTMEGADALHGITMQESGVSTLLSVKLADYEEGAS